MSRSTIRGCLVLAGVIVIGLSPHVYAQTWSVDASAGRIAYDPVSVNVGTNNVMGTLRYDALRGLWVYGTAAAPLRGTDPRWGAAGTGGRLQPAGGQLRRVFLGADLGAHAFLFRDAVVDQLGRGGTIEAIPFASVAVGPARVEMRGGWRGHTLSFAGVTGNRGVFETGARGAYGERVRVQGDVNWVHASEGTFPFVGSSIVYSSLPIQMWLQTGKWLSDELDEVTWGVGASLSLGWRAALWASVRQEAPDPLYWNAPRRTWSVGLTRQLGRPSPSLQPPPRPEAGGVVIQVSTADAPGDSLSIAGDFNNWQAAPMQREGRVWVIRLPLAPGVYNYAFRSARGEWFVPASVAGRRDDGMGGHVAVLVVG
jgi:hypothetical protein